MNREPDPSGQGISDVRRSESEKKFPESGKIKYQGKKWDNSRWWSSGGEPGSVELRGEEDGRQLYPHRAAPVHVHRTVHSYQLSRGVQSRQYLCNR